MNEQSIAYVSNGNKFIKSTIAVSSGKLIITRYKSDKVLYEFSTTEVEFGFDSSTVISPGMGMTGLAIYARDQYIKLYFINPYLVSAATIASFLLVTVLAVTLISQVGIVLGLFTFVAVSRYFSRLNRLNSNVEKFKKIVKKSGAKQKSIIVNPVLIDRLKKGGKVSAVLFSLLPVMFFAPFIAVTLLVGSGLILAHFVPISNTAGLYISAFISIIPCIPLAAFLYEGHKKSIRLLVLATLSAVDGSNQDMQSQAAESYHKVTDKIRKTYLMSAVVAISVLSIGALFYPKISLESGQNINQKVVAVLATGNSSQLSSLLCESIASKPDIDALVNRIPRNVSNPPRFSDQSFSRLSSKKLETNLVEDIYMSSWTQLGKSTQFSSAILIHSRSNGANQPTCVAYIRLVDYVVEKNESTNKYSRTKQETIIGKSETYNAQQYMGNPGIE